MIVTYLLCLLSNELSSDFIIEFYVDSDVFFDSHSLTVTLAERLSQSIADIL